MLRVVEIQRFIEVPDKPAVRAGAKPIHLFNRLRLKDEQSRGRRKHEPPVKPMLRIAFVPQGEALFEKRRRSLNVSTPPHPHEFPASRRGISYMFEHVRRVNKVEGSGGERKDRRFADNQRGCRRHHHGIAASFPSVRDVPLQQMGDAGERIVPRTDLQDSPREIGPSPPG